jgi:hypothetical protein
VGSNHVLQCIEVINPQLRARGLIAELLEAARWCRVNSTATAAPMRVSAASSRAAARQSRAARVTFTRPKIVHCVQRIALLKRVLPEKGVEILFNWV